MSGVGSVLDKIQLNLIKLNRELNLLNLLILGLFVKIKLLARCDSKVVRPWAIFFSGFLLAIPL